jgi:WD40 repeat protein
MMTLNNKRTVYKIGLINPFLSLISFLYVCSLISCFLFISTSISGNAFAGEKGWLGVQVQPVTGKNMRVLHMQYGRWEVIFVSEVIKGSPAEQMGIKQDDVILSVNYKDIKNINEFKDAVSALNPGDKIVLLVSRSKEKAQFITGTMGRSPGGAETEQITKPLEEARPVVTDRSAKIFAPTGHNRIISLGVSPDGKYIISGGDMKNSLKLWELSTGKEIRTFIGHTEDRVGSVAFSPDGRYALSGSSDKTVKLWDISTGKEIRTFTGHTGGVLSVAFSPDGRYAASGSGDKTIKLWDVSSGKEVNTFFGHTDAVSTIVFSHDGRYLLSGSFDKTLKLWDISTGNERRTFTGHAWQIASVAFSADGRHALSRSGDRIIKLWDMNTGKEIRTFSGDNVDVAGVATGSQMIVSGTFSPDGRYMLTTERSGAIKLWNVATGKAIRTFSGHTGWVPAVTFSNDVKSFISGGNDGTIRLWDINTGKEIAQFISLKDGEWIVLTPEGYFNASANGAKYLNVRVGNKVYSIDNFSEKFFNPVYVASVLQGKKVEAVADIRKGILTPPDVRITSPAPGKEFNTDTLTVTVAAKDTGGGIDEIRLYHNGKAIGEDTRAVKIVSRGSEAIREYTVSLVDGVNTFRAVGFSKDRTESNPYELIVKLSAPSKDVSLYVFAVGINKYKNPALNLNYAEPDALGITGFFKQQGKGLFKNVDIGELYNEQATKENIVSKLSQLQNINPQDAVLIYLAGHGENINDKWYFIPHELTYPEREEDVKIKGISSDELSGYMKNIKAQKILLLIDACKAGAVLIAFRGFEDRKALSQLSRSTGVHIVAASTKDQFAAEVKELGHGVFTYTLLEGLKGKASGGGDTVTVRKLMGYVEEKLPEITKKYKQEAQYPVVDSRGMDFPLAIAR